MTLNILNLMVQITDSKTMSKFYENLAKEIKNNTLAIINNNGNNNPNNLTILNNRAKIWLLLGSCITRINRMEIAKLLNSSLNIIFQHLNLTMTLQIANRKFYQMLKPL